MRARARQLGAYDTHVVSADGYDHPGQVSSAYDLTLFARAGLRNADFRDYCGTRVAGFPGHGGTSFQLQNTNRLLGEYSGMIGVKNGYTTNAGNTFTGAAERGGRTLLVTVMHPAYGYDEVYKEAALLLDWGFAAAEKVLPVGTLVEPAVARKKVSPGSGASPTPSATRALEPPSSGPSVQAGTAAVLSALISGCALALRRLPRPKPAGRRRRR
jgi:D-alanyl-D-alanine carboxypeptidase (penicillin-binding protein 5/6)